MTWREFISSDYNKIQSDYAGGNGDYIEGQFIIITNDDEDLVYFYGRLYDYYNGYEPAYHTLAVFSYVDEVLSVYSDDIIDSSCYYSSSNTHNGGSN